MPNNKRFWEKLKGNARPSPSSIDWGNACVGWLGGFLGIASIGWLSTIIGLSTLDRLFLIGSFGASAVLLYASPCAPFAQPRNLIGGHLISAVIGVTVYLLIPSPVWLSAALAVSTAIFAMVITHTIHPPGGATALIAVIGSETIHALTYWYLLSPVLYGVILLLIVALIVNNLVPGRHYPEHWV